MAWVSSVRGAALAAWLGEPATGARRRLQGVGRVLRGGKRRVTFYHRVDDPHSHLLAVALSTWAREWPIELELVVVPEPAADADPEPQLRERWALQDAALLALAHGLPFPAAPTVPEPSRVRAVNAALLERRTATETLDAAVQLGHALFAGDGETLHEATRTLGAVPGQRVGPALEANYAALRSRGHYQGAMIHYGGEWYWGIDRLDHLASRLRQEGVDAPLPAPTAPPRPAGWPARPEVELFASVRSPYSYLALERLARLEARGALRLQLRPVLPMVTRGLSVPRQKVFYIVKDVAREAARQGVPFGRICDPLGESVERALALYHFAAQRGRGVDLLLAVTRGVWSQAADLRDPKVLHRLAAQAGLTPADVSAALVDERWRDVARANRDALYERGHWGVPTICVGGLTLWGQDRLDWLERWLASG